MITVTGVGPVALACGLKCCVYVHVVLAGWQAGSLARLHSHRVSIA